MAAWSSGWSWRGGRWISEKDPGYPYLAVVFQALGVIRLAPLFYGALACLGLYAGGRRWLGRFGGAAAVGLFCSSGAAILFGWRDYMPGFTEASLIAAAAGALLWALLAADASARRRTWAGLGGFVALEAATLSRYTNIVVLGCAVIAALVAGYGTPTGTARAPAPAAHPLRVAASQPVRQLLPVGDRELPEPEEPADLRTVPLDRPPVPLDEAQVRGRHAHLGRHELHSLGLQLRAAPGNRPYRP
jgi:hypothetical protein